MTREIKSYTHKKQTKKIQKQKQTNKTKKYKNKTNKHGRKSQGMPSTDGASVGSRRIHKVALPLHRRMAQNLNVKSGECITLKISASRA